MSELATSNPVAAALAQALGPILMQNNQAFLEMSNKFCTSLAELQKQVSTIQAKRGDHDHAAGDCKCKGTGTDKQRCANGTCDMPGGGDATPMKWRPRGAFSECYGQCDKMDPCLFPYMEQAYGRTDDFDWAQRWIADPLIVHINKNVGAAPFNSPPLPLGAGQTALIAMEDLQSLPFQPGGLKVAPKWSADPGAPAEVSVTLYTGPKVVGPNTYTSIPTNWTQMGGVFTLADFECAKDCFILPWPKLMKCVVGPIPADQRAVYVQLQGSSSMGAITLTSLNFTVLKRGTDDWFSTCRQVGWDPSAGCRG